MSYADVLRVLAPYVAADIEHDNARTLRMRELVASGRRLVGGGSDGDGEWEIHDDATGETLASGLDDDEEVRTPGDDLWFHVDHVGDEDLDPFGELPRGYGPPDDPGVPDALRHALADVASDNRAELQAAMIAAGIELPDIA